jgi:hypothetical protein
LPDSLGDCPAVHWLKRNDLQDQQIQRPLHKLRGFTQCAPLSNRQHDNTSATFQEFLSFARNTGTLASVDAEIYTSIGLRLKKESPLANTVVVTLANGRANSGYIPNDTAFGAYTFQVLGSRLKPGYAETAIVDGLLDLIDRTQD